MSEPEPFRAMPHQPPDGAGFRFILLFLAVLVVVLCPAVDITETRCTHCQNGEIETVWSVTPVGPVFSREKKPLKSHFAPCDRHAFVGVRHRFGGGVVGLVRWVTGF